MKEKYVIIVAGGKGTRMGTDVPKQFLLLEGKPVLMHTIEAFFRYDKEISCIVVLPEEQHHYWTQLCEEHDFRYPHQVTTGGETRFHSVKNGLLMVPDKAFVAVHDGARPLVSVEVIDRCFKKVMSADAVIPVIPVWETVRYVGNGECRTVPREDYRLVQTPQVFDAMLLKQAYQQEYIKDFTDDASVVERLGYEVTTVEGNRENIKITTPIDIIIAKILLKECLI